MLEPDQEPATVPLPQPTGLVADEADDREDWPQGEPPGQGLVRDQDRPSVRAGPANGGG